MQIFGIVNVTPDSFSDGGRHLVVKSAVDHALRLEDEGASVLDVGGESTRPGATPVSVDEECARVLPVVERLAQRTGAEISIDTRKPEVARAAISAGASIWNDVTALRTGGDHAGLAAKLGCRVVLMHMQGNPASMQANPTYEDVTSEVLSFLEDRISACEAAGIPRRKIIADPGIGFGKTLAHNVEIFHDLKAFKDLGVELLIGASRKRFIAGLDRDGPPDTRLGGSIAAALRAQAAGWHWARVHDVAETRQALAVAAALR